MARRPSAPAAASREAAAWPIGCGVDVVDIERFARVVRRSGEAFLERIFTPQERAYAARHRDPVQRLAVRFAAKEAVVKAMSQVDPAHPLTLRQVEIRNDALGRPSVVLRAGRLAHQPPLIAVSLSHERHIAMASAVAVTRFAMPRRRSRTGAERR